MADPGAPLPTASFRLDQLNGRVRLMVSLGAGVVLGALVAYFFPIGAFGANFLATGCLLSFSLFILLSAWRWAGAGRLLAWMTALAFFLRLGFGLFLSVVVPAYGFDNETQNNGYVFFDAYRRDDQAWDLATSTKPLLQSFTQEFYTDQYGGLLALSALVYRYLSPDVQRPYLILILTAFIGALGLPFFWKGVRARWGDGVAKIAGWIMVLYPESVLLGSSQMREPFLITFGAIAFWAVLYWKENRRVAAGVFVASIFGLALFSSRVVLVVLGVLAVWFWLEYFASAWSQRRQVLVWVIFGLAAVGMLFLSWEWLHISATFDLFTTCSNSGIVQQVTRQVNENLCVPFVVVYGLTQPVLPAALAENTLPVWKYMVVLRSLGWYALAPLLLYAFFAVWKARPAAERRILLWLAGFSLVWVVISSIRGGGDVWDNPRYRTIFLPWLALLAAWAWCWAAEHKDAWLPRLLAAEAIFLLFFTQWYLSRYLRLWRKLPFWQMVILILVSCALVFGGSWLWDRWKAKRASRLD